MPENSSIWDVDGTLLDTAVLHLQIINQTLEKNHIDRKIDIHTYRTLYFGKRVSAVMKEVCGDLVTDEQCQEMAEYYFSEAGKAFKNVPELKIIPGVENVLSGFRDRGWGRAVASSSDLDFILILLEKSKLIRFMQNIVSGRFLPSKPAPDIYRIAAEAENSRPENCVVFEDAQAGLTGAKAAGMTSVGIATSLPVSKMKDVDIGLNSYLDFSFADLDRVMHQN